MTAPAPETAIGTLAAQQAAAQANLTNRLLVVLATLWQSLTDPANTEQLRTFATRGAAMLRAAELATGQLTETYLRQVLAAMNVDVPPRTLVELPDALRGVPDEEVILRPAATVRYLRSKDDPNAAEAGLERLRIMAETSLQLASRYAANRVVDQVPGVDGYRRILRPYLSAGGSCGLCVAASDRRYKRGDLMPIHARCKCSVLPIVGDNDPGMELNGYDLNAIYADSGGNTVAKLKRTRYVVEQHGELGPVLVLHGQKFRTEEQAAELRGVAA